MLETTKQTQQFSTLKDAAKSLGIPYWKLLQAANSGLIPTYRIINSRRYVKTAEIQQIIEKENHNGE